MDLKCCLSVWFCFHFQGTKWLVVRALQKKSTSDFLYLLVSVAEFGSPALAELNTFFKQYVEKYK